MPRIDPQQLLNCLKPLLGEDGGIKSHTEVNRIARLVQELTENCLMERYSKKLVSKCIYIQILKCTGAELLGQFMTVGGWNLVHTWLKDGNQSQNWPFVQEILEMFLLCPVDSNRLKSNHTPKIVKEMSENSPNPHLKQLSMKLVQQWLKIAYTEKQAQLASTDNNDNKVLNSDSIELKQASQEGIKYKISNKEEKGKILLSLKRSTSPASEVKEPKIAKIVESDKKLKDDKNDKEKSDKKSKSSSSSSSHKSSSKSSHKDKDRSSSSRSKSSSSSSSSKDKHHKSSSSSSKSSSSSSSRDKSKDKDKDREKRKKEEKEKAEKAQAEKDKETLSFLQPLPSAKLTKIPKKSENSENKSSDGNSIKTEPEKKKPSFSIESRSGDKPKTVKTLNSQFRDHGLAAEAPKPPSRKDIKKPGAITTPVIAPLTVIPSIAKSSSVISPTTVKKDKLEKALEVDDIPERVGGAKLIKPKPMIMESIGFMDALNASSTVKKDPKKRKRLPSGSSSTSTSKKDEPESPKIDHKPLKFYKDTLEENDEKTTNGETSPTKELDNSSTSIEESVEKQENGDKTSIASPNNKDEETKITEEEQEDVVRPPGIGCGPDGPPGVLVNPALQRRKKRPVRWREGDELTEVRYFELDENERINVTKRPFNEQMQHEHANEGSALQRGRQLQNDDAMTEQIAWRPLIIVDNVPTYAYGSKSNEANIQAERERNVLQAFFIPNQSINDSPLEPNHESYEHVEPQMIPLDDQTNNPEAVMDYTEIQWPLPKGDIINTIHPTANAFATMFNSNIPSNIAINNSSISNPLLPFGGNQTNSMWTIPPVSFQQPPPNLMPNHQGGNRGNFNNFNNRHNNNGNNNNGGNWIRGNAGGRRIGVCHQFRRNGVCRNQQCPYIHER